MSVPPSAPTRPFSLQPLMFENFVCTLSMMSFVALIGPIARLLGLAPWQAGMAVTVGGLAWLLLASTLWALWAARGSGSVLEAGRVG